LASKKKKKQWNEPKSLYGKGRRREIGSSKKIRWKSEKKKKRGSSKGTRVVWGGTRQKAAENGMREGKKAARGVWVLGGVGDQSRKKVAKRCDRPTHHSRGEKYVRWYEFKRLRPKNTVSEISGKRGQSNRENI